MLLAPKHPMHRTLPTGCSGPVWGAMEAEFESPPENYAPLGQAMLCFSNVTVLSSM